MDQPTTLCQGDDLFRGLQAGHAAHHAAVLRKRYLETPLATITIRYSLLKTIVSLNSDFTALISPLMVMVLPLWKG